MLLFSGFGYFQKNEDVLLYIYEYEYSFLALPRTPVLFTYEYDKWPFFYDCSLAKFSSK